MYQVQQVAYLSGLYHAAVALRNRVLREPLGLSYSTAQLAAESVQYHFVATDKYNKVIGVLLLQQENNTTLKMRQVAVAPELQRQGIGSMLVAAAEQFAITHHFPNMILHARAEAIPFYTVLSYQKVGEEFEEVGIPHYKMQRYLLSED